MQLLGGYFYSDIAGDGDIVTYLSKGPGGHESTPEKCVSAKTTRFNTFLVHFRLSRSLITMFVIPSRGR